MTEYARSVVLLETLWIISNQPPVVKREKILHNKAVREDLPWVNCAVIMCDTRFH